MRTEQNYHQYIIPLFILSLLVLVGCGGGFSEGDPGQRDDDFKTGSGSIDLSFARNAPPKEVYSEQTSTAAIRVDNVGAFTVRNGFLTLSYDRAVLDFMEGNTKSFAIDGKSLTFPNGDTKILTFPFDVLPLATESQIRETALVANVCYDYQTEVLETVCVDTDPYDLKPDSERSEEVCELRDLSPGGTGGPVRVNKIDVQFITKEGLLLPQFVIEIGQSNYQRDKIYAPGNANVFCSASQFNNDALSVVDFAVTLSDQDLVCNRDQIRLIEGKATITCEGRAIDETRGNYEAPLYVRLDYGVSKSETFKLNVIR